jgi:predicted Zn-dependent protease
MIAPSRFARLLAPLLALALACAPLAVRAASDGEKALQEFRAQGVVHDGELADYVARVGARVAASAGLEAGEITFTLLDDPQVNAFAMAGGYVFVARGLLAYLESEDQLAAVLGHEVAHLTARHPQQRKTYSRTSAIASTLLGFLTRSGALYQTAQAYSAAALSGYGREQELEADGLGAQYLAAAGYDPIAMLDVIRILKDQDTYSREVEKRASSYHGLFASHPRNDRRLFEVVQAGGAAAEPPDEVVREGDFLALLDGLAWGDAAADGLIRGRRYYHGSFGFVIDFPEEWRVTDSPTAITATAPHGTRTIVTVEMQKLEDPDDLTPEAFVTERLGVAVRGGREIEVDGMSGFMALEVEPEPEAVAAAATGDEAEDAGEAAAGTPRAGEDEYALKLVAVVFKDDSAYVIRGENRLAEFEGEFVEGFSRTVASFRRMRRSDVEEATTTRVRTVVATPEDTYEALAREASLGRDGADRLRLLNGDYPRGQPRAGDRIKIIR